MSNKPYEILKAKAIKHVWQNPARDKVSILELSRLSPRNGYTDVGKVGWDTLVTPTKKGYYHYYQIGGNIPSQFNLNAVKYQWYRLSDWCKVSDLVVRVYNKEGKLIPIDNVFTYRMYNGNLIIGILRDDSIVDLNEDKVYIHFYRNLFYSLRQKDNEVNHTVYLSNVQRRTVSSQLLWDYKRLNLPENSIVRWVNNGYFVDGIKQEDIKLGDTTELFYDMSIWGYQDFPLDALRTFKSSLDEKTKYLIHPDKDNRKHVIYRDDIDIYICQYGKTEEGRIDRSKCKGLWYHRNQEDSVRMVTHRDYSLPVPYVMSYIETLAEHPDLTEFFIRIYFRDNGVQHDIVDDVNNIKALYQLDDDKIVEAMVTVNSTIPEWTADHLERSPYTVLMRCRYDEINPKLVLDAMGYNSTVRLLANPNNRVTLSPNGNYFLLPDGLYKNSTVFEYNEKGLLLGWYLHSELMKYYPRHAQCVFVEVIAGTGGDELTYHEGKHPFDLKDETAYRFFSCKKEGDNLIDEWEDVTGTDRVVIDKQRCHMVQKPKGELMFALGDDKFLCYETLLDGNDGIYDFQITVGQEHVKPLLVPPGKIDLWMNGFALVEGIDYFIDFPKVNIVAKKYVSHGDYQKVVVRCNGFPFLVGNKLRRVLPRETGFVKYGKVSVNNHFDLHSDKLTRMVVNGGVFDPDIIPLDEMGDTDVSKGMSDGVPYSIETPYVALVGTMNIYLYNQQIRDFDLTNRISDYLTVRIPRKEQPLPPVLVGLHEVFSPFLSKITMDLKYGRFQSPPPNTPPQTIDKIVTRYKHYLATDPIMRGYDDHYVTVHPHNQQGVVELSPRDIEFLKKLNELYFKNKVDLRPFYRTRKGI